MQTCDPGRNNNKISRHSCATHPQSTEPAGGSSCVAERLQSNYLRSCHDPQYLENKRVTPHPLPLTRIASHIQFTQTYHHRSHSRTQSQSAPPVPSYGRSPAQQTTQLGARLECSEQYSRGAYAGQCHKGDVAGAGNDDGAGNDNGKDDGPDSIHGRCAQ